MNPHLVDLAKQNITALYSMSALLHASGYWNPDSDCELDAAITIRDLIQNLVWTDRNLHRNECLLLDVALEVDESHGGHLKGLIDILPNPSGTDTRIPRSLAAAALHDAAHHTRLFRLLHNHLENLGLIVLMADATVRRDEVKAFDEYFAELEGALASDSKPAE